MVVREHGEGIFNMTPPQFPVGEYIAEQAIDARQRAELIAEIAGAPVRLRAALAGLTDAQLDTRYKNWTVRQIAAHLCDSHTNAFVRFKLALTEDGPTIKPYDENRWVALQDARAADLGVALAFFEALHARWVQLLQAMSAADFERFYVHPEYGTKVSLAEALSQYAWHGRHHMGQLEWLRDQHGWER